MVARAAPADDPLSPYMRFTLRNPSERAGEVVPHRLFKQPEYAATSIKYRRVPEPTAPFPPDDDDDELEEPSSFPPAYPRPFSMPSRASLLDCLTDDESVASTALDRTSFRRSQAAAREATLDFDSFRKSGVARGGGPAAAAAPRRSTASPRVRTTPVAQRARPAASSVKRTSSACGRLDRYGEPLRGRSPALGRRTNTPRQHYFNDPDDDDDDDGGGGDGGVRFYGGHGGNGDDDGGFSAFYGSRRPGARGSPIIKRPKPNSGQRSSARLEVRWESGGAKRAARKRFHFGRPDVHMPAANIATTRRGYGAGAAGASAGAGGDDGGADDRAEHEKLKSVSARLSRYNSLGLFKPSRVRRDAGPDGGGARRTGHVREGKAGRKEADLVRGSSLFGRPPRVHEQTADWAGDPQNYDLDASETKWYAKVRHAWARKGS